MQISDVYKRATSCVNKHTKTIQREYIIVITR